MKKNINQVFNNTMSIEAMSKLTSITNETLAFDFVPEKKRIFTAAEMWDIQRRRRVIPSRRYL